MQPQDPTNPWQQPLPVNMQTPTDHRRNKPWYFRWWALLIFAIVILFVGIGIGAGGSSGQIDDLEKEVSALKADGNTEPEVRTVTSVVTETETVEVEKTPQVCLDALDTAEAMFGITQEFATVSADSFGIVSAVFTDLSYGDLSSVDFYVSQMESNTEKINGLTDQVEVLVPVWQSESDDCRSAG